MVIERYAGTMSSRERVRRAFCHEKADRVPVGYDTNPLIHRKFMNALGAANDDAVLDLIGADMRGIQPSYTGPRLHPERPNRAVSSEVGTVTRYVANQSGGYWDYCDFPLKGVSDEALANFPLPNPDDYDYEALAARVKRYAGYSLYTGGPGSGDIMNSLGMLMGVEDALVNLLGEDEATLAYVDRRVAWQLGVIERTFEACGEALDVLWLGEDLGTQHTPMISMDMYRRVLKPRHKKFVDLAKAYGKFTMIHTCGSSSWAYPEFIELGVDAVDTLQPEATNMEPEYLAKTFGGKLAFRGCVSTAGPLAYGTPEDVEKTVRDTLEVMMPTKAYILAPTHAIQDNTPVENIFAMYNAAHKYGRY